MLDTEQKNDVQMELTPIKSDIHDSYDKSRSLLLEMIQNIYTRVIIFLLIILDLILYITHNYSDHVIEPTIISYITCCVLGIYLIEIILTSLPSFSICNSYTHQNKKQKKSQSPSYNDTNISITEKQSLLNNKDSDTKVNIPSKSLVKLRQEISTEFDKFCGILIVCGICGILIGSFTLEYQTMIVTSFAIIICILSFIYCSYTVKWIMNQDIGTIEMQNIANYIREGANSYLKTQYMIIAKIAILVAIILIIIYLFRPKQSDNVSPIILSIVTAISFLIGSFCSALAGYTGVWTSVRVNLRVAAAAAKYDYESSFLLAFRGGAVSAIISAAMCILGISFLYIIGTLIFVRFMEMEEYEVPILLGGYGFGASFVALFMQLGGGIFTKAADVGADMCGKIEKGIPEDDPRNPAVIADLVGDNVGDCAGSMADVFESIAAEMIGTMILGATLAQKSNVESVEMFIFFPLIIHSLDLLVSIIGIQSTIPSSPNEDPIIPMKRGYLVSLIFAIIGYLITCRIMLYTIIAVNAWWHYALCGLVGLLCAYFIVLITQYYTDYTNYPVLQIVSASYSGHGTNIITGIAIGMESTAPPAIIISISLFLSYTLGYTSGLPDEHLAGLFGTACATMGMLCTAVYVLSMNNFGPISDNAGGIVEMSEQPHDVRVITDRLDAVGNVTKAATKGYAVGGSALACFLLFNAFLDEIGILTTINIESVDITKVEIMISGLLGIMMVFLFTGWSINAVGRTAQEVVREVRRQFNEINGIMEYKNKPQYGKCVEIVTRSALKEMISPALLALLSPIMVGLMFKYIGLYRYNETMLGIESIASFLMFSTITGLLMAIFLDNSGGAWDNAKKYIEAKKLKNTEVHAAAVTGDTVGDPFKDTAGPALHVVITTMSTTALVLGPLFVAKL